MSTQGSLRGAESGLWEVRNYFTTLEKRAAAGAEVTGGYLSMVVAAAVLSTGGLLLDSPAAVIGSMCVAPFMAPSRAVSIGALFGNWRVCARGLVKQLFGLLFVGAGIAYVLTTALNASVEGIGLTHEILVRAMSDPREVALSALIAIGAGAAASLALTAQPRLVETPWGQVLDAIIGVEIAVSLLPPATVVGIGLALGLPQVSTEALALMLLNVVGLDVIGSLLIFALSGIRRRHLELEKIVRAATEDTIEVVPGFVAVGSTVDVTLLRSGGLKIDAVVRRRFGGKVPESLAREIGNRVERETGRRTEVTVEVVPLLTHPAT